MSASSVTVREGERECRVADKRVVAEDVVALTLVDAAGDALPSWTPGAHIDVMLGESLTRQYSLCGDRADADAWRIGILRELGGRGGSAHVYDVLQPGATVRVRGPRNHFPFVAADGYLFIAGGIGITPLLPMVEAAAASDADWKLLYGGRRRASMAFLDELEAHGDRVAVWPQDERGLLDLPAELDPPRAGTLVYCCGPEPLLAAVEAQCASWPPDSLRVERFAPRPNAGPAADAAGAGDSFEVVLQRSGVTLTVPPGKSILETCEEAGVSVLSSCREGICATCETDVLEGTPDHRDSVLTPSERASGELMMICVSRSLGPRLVLDL